MKDPSRKILSVGYKTHETLEFEMKGRTIFLCIGFPFIVSHVGAVVQLDVIVTQRFFDEQLPLLLHSILVR